jgi:hypothetical protein
MALHRARLGFLLIWRKRALPMEEVRSYSERMADRQRALEELRLAAEEYHWAVINERRRPVTTPTAAMATSANPVAAARPPDRPGA